MSSSTSEAPSGTRQSSSSSSAPDEEYKVDSVHIARYANLLPPAFPGLNQQESKQMMDRLSTFDLVALVDHGQYPEIQKFTNGLDPKIGVYLIGKATNKLSTPLPQNVLLHPFTVSNSGQKDSKDVVITFVHGVLDLHLPETTSLCTLSTHTFANELCTSSCTTGYRKVFCINPDPSQIFSTTKNPVVIANYKAIMEILNKVLRNRSSLRSGLVKAELFE